MKFSYSQYSTFSKCSRFWSNNYVLKLEGETIGFSLIFGAACDAAITAMLEKKSWQGVFANRFKTAMINGKAIDTFDNPSIMAANNDFDSDVLTKEDIDLMKTWVIELNLGYLGVNPIEVFKEVLRTKKNPYKKTTDEIMKYFSRCSWLSLLRKGDILIQAFYEQFYPKITEVIHTQKHTTIKDNNTGDSIVGVVDMIVKLKDYGNEPIILDLKTAAYPYDAAQLETSNQLTLYAAMMREEFPLPAKVGYVVLCKNIPKDIVATCSNCGYTKDGRHKTCNKVSVTGLRCEGNWVENTVLKPEVQVLIESKNETQVNDLLVDFSNVIVMAKNGLTFRNTDICDNFYGAPCVYKGLCWKGNQEGLKKKGS